ncbi:Helix-turn-helix domain-containing protein [Micromonospora chokoriensis]|uniref:Helix-turn-helix domain-containing protein n=1 Tax=Micromonospora chokoriensis TaxID=356851 RepID=A0A1C4UDC1_9ACTN|nr:Helix-turn-helix domain-containing protein [Micromonospora chokoriensis]
MRRRRLGIILRDLRIAARLTGEEVGQRVERSASWVSRVEHGRVGLRSRDLHDLLDALEVTSEETREALTQLARESKQRGWWNRYGQTITGPYASFISFEHEATGLLCYETIVVNGLLQTEAYARALNDRATSVQVSEDADRQVQIKLNRQQRLTGEHPPELWVILDEAVLRRPFGGPSVMRDQLLHLATTADEMPHVSIQVLPHRQAIFPGMIASFTLMEFPAPDTSIVFSEGLTGAVHGEAEEAARCTIIFNELRAAALSKRDSIRELREAAQMMGEQ